MKTFAQELRKRGVCVYLAADETVAKDIQSYFDEAASRLDRAIDALREHGFDEFADSLEAPMESPKANP